MAGLCAAARARELGARPLVVEKGTRPGGSMLLSSCVVWRHRSLEAFRRECPAGDPDLQRTIVDSLDEGLAWLEQLGAPVVARETGNPLTVGMRFDPRGLTEALLEAAGEVRLRTPLGKPDGPLILATGGFQGNGALVERYVRPAGRIRLRANPWSAGDGLLLGLARSADLTAGMDEFYGRNMPDCDFCEEEFVPLAQLYGRYAQIFNERGEQFFRGEMSWSENDLVQATARQPGAVAWYVLAEGALEQRVRERTVREMVEAAPTRVDPGELHFPAPPDAVAAVRVRPGITHTIGGLRIDAGARILRADGEPVEGVFACGVDAGGVATGGYASGLAAALVFGRIAAESALA
jgi:succinate dehydrogenase/fumarate reductase flavoprotein subunit